MANPSFIRGVTKADATFTNTDSLTFDCGTGSDRALLITALDGVANASRYPTSITVGGVTMTGTAPTFDAINGNGYAAFQLTSANGLPDGSQTIVINMASGTGVGRPIMIVGLWDTTATASSPVAGGAFNSTISRTAVTAAGQVVVVTAIVDPIGSIVSPIGSALSRIDDSAYYQLEMLEQTAVGASTTVSAGLDANHVWFGHTWVLTGSSGGAIIPVLTSPTGTSTGSTTATGSVSTDTSGGTLYRLASTNAVETAATIKAANLTQAVSSTGVQTVSFTGLTASTSYYAHYVHVSTTAHDSNVVNSTVFVTGGSGDVTLPTLTGAVTPGTVTSNSIAIDHPAGADNVGVTTYEYSSDGGSSYTPSGSLSTSYVFTGLTANTSYSLRVRAKDAAGNVSTPALALTQATLPASSTATITSEIFENEWGVPLTSTMIHNVVVLSLNRTPVLSLTNQTTNSAGRLIITSASLSSNTHYMLSTWNADGTACGNKVYLAS